MWVSLLFLLSLVTVVATVLGAVAVLRVRRRAYADKRPPGPTTELVTVLKPLCGADDRLEANLRTFFEQQGVAFELVFGVEGPDDPAATVVRRLRSEYPAVPAALVVHDGGRGLNPKVSNLRAMVGAARGDLVVISDSNIAVENTWLARMAADFRTEADTGLLTSLFVGAGEETMGATLENLHLAGPVASSIAASNEFGRAVAAVGKSMMFRLSVFERLGGWESVAPVLAEDYVMGRMFAEAGLRVRLGTTVITNVCARATVGAFLRRHLRWTLIRSRVIPHIHVFEPLFNTMFPAVLGLGLGGAAGAALIAAGLGLTLARDAVQWWALRGPRGLWRALPLGPAKEIAMLGVWLMAPFAGRVSWRGRSYRVGAGTRLYARRTMEPPRAWSCE